MLVLSRRTDQRIVIGKDIVVTIVSVSGSGDRATVRVGIEAPRSIPVWRAEVVEEVREEMARASHWDPAAGAPTELKGLLDPPSDKEGD